MVRQHRHRWPKSVHCQIEAIFHGIRAFRSTKSESPQRIRSAGAWKVYRYEAHRLADYFVEHGGFDILNTGEFGKSVGGYLEEVIRRFAHKQRSRQTMETILAAVAKTEYALNMYIRDHALDVLPLETAKTCEEYADKCRRLLSKSSRSFSGRAYPDPVALIAALPSEALSLVASLQYDSGLRCEGAGSPSNRRMLNPLRSDALLGYGDDPVTGSQVGIINVREKGGKYTPHYLSPPLYLRLERYLAQHDALSVSYDDYLTALNDAARKTGQFASGRGTHGLKHSFALERYHECVQHGFTHEQALQQTSLELAHNRLRETLTYTRS